MKRNSITKTRETYSIPPNGNPDNHRVNELRGMSHTDKTPTGLYIKKNETLEIEVSDDGLFLSVGQWGAYSYLNNNEDIGFTNFPLKSGLNTITFEKGDAMIYFVNKNEQNSGKIITATLEGGRPVPVFIKNKTTQEEWIEQMDTYSDAPFTEFISDFVLATYQYSIADEFGRDIDINHALNHWDEHYQDQNAVHGLLEKLNGVAHKYFNRIHFTTPDEGGGYAFATNYRVGFQKNTGAAKEILVNSAKTPAGSWTVFHEVGHTYQNPLYKMSYAGEVTVNIPAHIINEKLGFGDRFDDHKKSSIKQYVESDGIKDFANPPFNNDTNLWVRLGMFIQLYKAYGENFYPRLNQEYRILINPNITDDESKLQNFVLISSTITERNLNTFFEKWGIYANQEIIEKIKNYPEPSVPIWENIFNEDLIDTLLPSYQPPNAIPREAEYVIGITPDESKLHDFLENIEVAVPPYTVNWVADNNVAKNTTLSIIITDADKNRNKFILPTTFSHGNAITFNNPTYNKERIITTLNPISKNIIAFNDKMDKSALESGEGAFAELSVYNSAGELKHSFSADRNGDGSDYVDLISGTPYENGQYIVISAFSSRRLAAYRDGSLILPRDESKSKEFFTIDNDKLILLRTEDVKPQATPIPTSTNIGTPVPADNLLKNIRVYFGKSSVNYKSEPNFYVPGEIIAEVEVHDEQENKETFFVPLTVNYETSISMQAYGTEERAVIRIDPDTSEIKAFSNPQLQTNIQSGNGKYFGFTLYDTNFSIIKNVSANREEKPFEFINQINNTVYEDEGYIHIFIADRGKIAAYVMNNLLYPRSESYTDEWFLIAYGELIRIDSPI